jgi:RNA polymerase sigma factor (TIGR02999 family)
VLARADLTGLLQAWSRGDEQALDQLAPLVHRELREMARRILAGERRDGRLQPTELVQESYLRLLEWQTVQWQNRAHFFATTARMMRRVLVDAARARQSAKRGGGAPVVQLEPDRVAAPSPPVDVVMLGEALDALAAIEPRASRVVEMRFFGGFTVEETAEALAVSPRTVINDWNTARAWLFSRLSGVDGT